MNKNYEFNHKRIFEFLNRYNLTTKEKEYIVNRFTNAIRQCGDTCLNNFRLCDKNIKTEMREYNKRKSKGCCGFWDEIIKLKSGREFIFGFNYGY